MTRPFLLETRLVEKVWGRDTLPAPFVAPEGKRIGEIWFEPPAEMPAILAKYLFTSEKLSVQVHPGASDALPGEDGKEECWLVIDAEPGASLAIGFKAAHSRDEIEAAALSGEIEALLTWHEAKPGDIFYLPAGTVHAIGPGLSLVELQQNSDTTFRLYDYGRPRELHLERAMAVADCGPYPSSLKSNVAERGEALIEGPHFRLDRVEGTPGERLCSAYSGPLLALPLEGAVMCSDGGARAEGGQCLYAASLDALDFAEAGVTLLARPT